ncbi:unnamed protein product [Rangifer tarandus platyrhynchus]|uniref:Uncharacterized protein n=1 Tax=Rangifer tarandus platyrhynchus TaxID=3082113 RepID=A0ABN8Y2A2_RANTA|nr:unnamed protein product [Rangifer tarandus platyrhynchus]
MPGAPAREPEDPSQLVGPCGPRALPAACAARFPLPPGQRAGGRAWPRRPPRSASFWPRRTKNLGPGGL